MKKKSFVLLASLLLLLVVPKLRGQHVQPLAPVGFQSTNGVVAFLRVDGSGNLLMANGSGGYSPPQQALPVGYVLPYAMMAQNPSGQFVYVRVDSNGNIEVAGAGNATSIQGNPVSTNTPSTGQCLVFSSGTWAPASCATGGTTTINVNGTAALTQNPVNFENGTNVTVTNPTVGNIQFSISGTIPIANGGTGQATPAAAFNALAPATATGGLIVGTGTNAYGNLALGGSGTCLGSSGTALSWSVCGAGTVTSVGITGTANEITVTGTSPITSSGTLTLSIPTNPTLPGTTTGTFSGNLTGNVTGNVSGTAATITGALSLTNTPLTTSQDILFDNAGTLGRLPIVTSGQCLGNSAGAWASLACSGGGAVSSISGDGTLISNSASTGAVTLTLANAAAMSLWGNPGTIAGAPGYTSNPLLSSLLLQPTSTVTGATLRVFCDTGAEDCLRVVTNAGVYGIKVDTAGAVWAGDATHSGQFHLFNGANGLNTLVQSFVTASGVVFNLPASNGTSGQALLSGGGGSSPMTWGSVLTNPMTTLGDTMYGGASGVVTRLAGPTVNGTYCEQEVVTASAAVAPTWGTCGSGSGTVTSVSAGNLSPLFTASVATPTTTPALTFALSSAAADSWFGNATGASAAPAFNTSAFPTSLIPNPAGDVTGTYAATTVVGLHFGATALALGTVPSSGQCLEYNGTNITGAACSGGTGLPASWSIGTGNFVTAAPAAATDTTTLSIAPSLATGGTFNIAQIGNSSLTTPQVGCTANVYWAIQFNGNMCFSASNLQLATTAAPPYLYLNGIQGNPGQPYLEASTARLNVPASTASNTTTGGTVAANTYFFKVTWVNPAGETTGSTETSTTTTGTTSTITLTAPGAQYSAFGYQIYESTTSGAEQLVVPTSGNCILSASTFGGNAVCAPTSAATFTATPAGATINVPTVNTTGGAYIDAFAPAADGVGMFVSNGTPGADATVGAGVSLIGGTGLNLTSGTTTTAGTLACLSGTETASQCASSPASGVVGVFVSSGQNALVQTGGIATINLAASATTTYNHYACASTSGTIVDSATPCSGVQQVGIIAQTNVVSVTSVPVFLMTQGAGGGCSNCLVQNPTTTAANTITAQNTTAVPLTINGFGNTGGDAFDVTNNGFQAIRVNAFGDLIGGKDIQSLGDINVDANQTGAHLIFGSSSDLITFANTATASGGIRGQIVLTSQTSNAVTFPLAYGSAPVCTLTPTSNPGSLTWWVTTTNAAVTAHLSNSGTVTFNYICVGFPN